MFRVACSARSARSAAGDIAGRGGPFLSATSVNIPSLIRRPSLCKSQFRRAGQVVESRPSRPAPWRTLERGRLGRLLLPPSPSFDGLAYVTAPVLLLREQLVVGSAPKTQVVERIGTTLCPCFIVIDLQECSSPAQLAVAIDVAAAEPITLEQATFRFVRDVRSRSR